jgi:hypothetical protein
MLLVRVPWADRVMALPFLTLLAPSKRFYADKTRAPKTLLDWARQAALQIHRWLPDRSIVLVGDSAFAAIEFLAAVRSYVCVVTRLRLDANLFDFLPQKRKGRGRRPIKGEPLKKLSAVIKDRKVSWKRYRVSLWCGRTNRLVEITTGTAMGIMPACRRCRSAGFSSAIPKANSSGKATKIVNACLADNSRTMDDLVAAALPPKIDEIERIDRLISIAETRRDASLHEIDRRDALLGEALRRKLQEVEAGNLKVIEKPALGKNAA